MSNFEIIKNKLEAFIRKFYVNELIKGSILFVSIGVLYLIVTLLIEYFLWLPSIGRSLLFWLFILVAIGLLVKFIIIPLFRLFRLTKGLNFLNASKMIGNHFPEVNDKLINLLQLNDDGNKSDLLAASIEQKSLELKPIPFKVAVDLKKNVSYAKYLLIPLALFLLVSFFGGIHWFSDSYTRVVNYQTAYVPPAPFEFFVVNEELNALENHDYVLKVKTVGDVIPENASIQFNDESYFLKSISAGSFEYKFTKPKNDITFSIEANGIHSKKYKLQVVPVPVLLSFDMVLDYPSYTKKKDEIIKSSGSAVIPEGTNVTWKINTRNVEKVNLKTIDTVISFKQNREQFEYTSRVFNNLDYLLSTSNANVSDYDNLSFLLKVIKDQYPEIKLQAKRDSLGSEKMFFKGTLNDDYGLHQLNLVYYNTKKPDSKNRIRIPISKNVYEEFIYVFPYNIELTDGIDYEFFFEVSDNDVLHGYKKTKSKVFNYRALTEDERKNKVLQEQNKAISGLNKSLKEFKNQENELKELSKLQKEKKKLDFNDQKKLENFLERQKKEEEMMMNFSKKLKESLEKHTSKKEEPFKDALKERLERNEQRLKKNEELIKKINELSDKIDKEKLTEKLEDLAKENKNIKRNLEQLLELTKRFYVKEKQEKIADDLQKLAEKQEKLATKNEDENTKEKQEEINKEFNEIEKELKDLKEQNEDLKKPMDVGANEKDKQDIKEQQKQASDNLEKEKTSDAKKNQKSAAQKMKEMSDKMKMQMSANGEIEMMEDEEMLRQILDNLVDFSIEQEDLMNDFKNIKIDNPIYSSNLKYQSVLRENFLHIDDSIYALALRTPKITEDITDKLTEIEYNIENALKKLSDNQLFPATSNQQYTVKGANDLAYQLSRILGQMQNATPSSGSGKSGKNEFQLPDIIKKQGELNQKMEEGMKKGESQGKGSKGEKENGEKKNTSKEGEKEGENDNGKKKGKGKKDGNNNEGGNGDEQRNEQLQREELDGELFEIYKQQLELRNKLQDKIEEIGLGNKKSKNLLNRMKQVERDLLDKGFDKETLKRMVNLKHELFKLKEASFQQGEDSKRQSETNKKEFDQDNPSILNDAKQYFNTTEILNRQVLPLRQKYKGKVQQYFKEKND
ncbi:hypothetical protein HN014_07095 [Aquimarina sp. TRL1]|uniref:DUF4175 family protein n=1 Tax=Aquimarina sp. (strain TRL1) TaxID=2736252 RepID=UPI00158E0086|nr:DUF4175 family protein [Aquimarina sp. TRL1]QKX04687.1 hypothetical protein HN014_07095 [Aquimarina sp. TRL1]